MNNRDMAARLRNIAATYVSENLSHYKAALISGADALELMDESVAIIKFMLSIYGLDESGSGNDSKWLFIHEKLIEAKERYEQLVNKLTGADHIVDANKMVEPKPLTVDELCQMDGEPVWIIALEDAHENPPYWAIIRKCDGHEYGAGVYLYTFLYGHGIYGAFSLYGKTWLAYAHKLQEASDE